MTKSKSGESVTMDSLETKQNDTLLPLGEELHRCCINTVVVRAAAEGIISARDITKLTSHGGHINITKDGQCPYLTEWDM